MRVSTVVEKDEDDVLPRDKADSPVRMTCNTKLIDVDSPTPNGRIYTRQCIEQVIRDFEENKRAILGKVGPWEAPVLHLSDVSHQVKRMWLEGDSLMAEIETLDTPNGRLLAANFDKVTYAMTGFGAVSDSGVIQDDYRLSSINAIPK